MTNGDKNAFPCDGQYAGEARSSGDAGLSKREIFAAMIMAGLRAKQIGTKSPAQIAIYAVEDADALIAALNTPQPAPAEGGRDE